MWRELRRDSICKGGRDGARGCPVASSVSCTECGAVWECNDAGPPDKRLSLYTGNCGSCGSSSVKLSRCDDCAVTTLDSVRASSHAGALLDRVLELEFDLKHGLARVETIVCEERDGLKILEQERGKWEVEEMRERDRDREQQQAMRTVQAGGALRGGRG